MFIDETIKPYKDREDNAPVYSVKKVGEDINGNDCVLLTLQNAIETEGTQLNADALNQLVDKEVLNHNLEGKQDKYLPNADLNTLVASGSYHAFGAINFPFPHSGLATIEVQPGPQSEQITQTVTMVDCASGQLQTRFAMRTGTQLTPDGDTAATYEWEKWTVQDDISVCSHESVVKTLTNVQTNKIVEPGYYIVKYTETSASLKNPFSGNVPCVYHLNVYQKDTVLYQVASIIQYEDSMPRLYYAARSRIDQAWTSWNKIDGSAFFDEAPAVSSLTYQSKDGIYRVPGSLLSQLNENPYMDGIMLQSNQLIVIFTPFHIYTKKNNSMAMQRLTDKSLPVLNHADTTLRFNMATEVTGNTAFAATIDSNYMPIRSGVVNEAVIHVACGDTVPSITFADNIFGNIRWQNGTAPIMAPNRDYELFIWTYDTVIFYGTWGEFYAEA